MNDLQRKKLGAMGVLKKGETKEIAPTWYDRKKSKSTAPNIALPNFILSSFDFNKSCFGDITTAFCILISPDPITGLKPSANSSMYLEPFVE